MQRLFVIAGSMLALTACSSMEGMIKDHHGAYGELAKIARKHDAQHALLFTREGELVVVNAATGEIVEPGEGLKAAPGNGRGEPTDTKVSDEEFAEIKRKFDSTITMEVERGSVCINIAKQPPGQQWMICSPPYPRWW